MLPNIGDKFADLKKRLWFLLGALIVYRIGTHVPLPGIDPVWLAKNFGQGSKGNGILDMFNMFSGGALSRMSVLTIGIMPYISASIILQLASEILPSLKELKKEGESGRRKITQYTRYATVLLATLQGFGAAAMLVHQKDAIIVSPSEFYFTSVICLVAGTMFLMWLGEQVTERGVGNGISVLICAGIAANVPMGLAQLLTSTSKGNISEWVAILVIILVLVVTYGVVFFERALRKIPIQYAKRQVGLGMVTQSHASHLPLKLNMSGVIPAIFASSLLLFPASLAGWFGSNPSMAWLKDVSNVLMPGQPIYVLTFAALIIFFCFFYTALVFNPRETADNLKKSGALVPGYRPGEQTAKYIERIILRLTLIGAVYVTAVCLLPELLRFKANVPFQFGGTSLLIIVVVSMDFMAQVQSLILSQQYEGLLRKANLKGGLGAR